MRDRSSSWRPDGAVFYYIDRENQWVGALPRHCKLLRHDLAYDGYTALVRRCQDRRPPETRDVLVVICTACYRDHDPDHAWALVLGDRPPDRVELDDRPYSGIEPQYIRQPVEL